jgi:uncharacterized protein (TIRG00374 family)
MSVLKGLRFSFVLGIPNFRLTKLFYVAVIHGFFISILPARLGEISLPFLFKKYFDVNISTGVISLVILRIFDVVFLLPCAIWAASTIKVFSDYSTEVLVFSTVLLSLAVFTIVNLEKPIAFIAQAVVMVRQSKYIVSPSLGKRFLKGILSARRWTRRAKPRWYYARLLLITAAMWTSAFSIYYFQFKAFGVDLPAIDAVFVATGTNLVGLLPISSVGGIGIGEAGLAGLLYLIEFEPRQATTLGLVVRLSLVIFPVLQAAFVFALYQIVRRTTAARR